MSNILILHGPSQYEVSKAYSISKYLGDRTPHKLSALADQSLVQKNTQVNLFKFITDPLGRAGIVNFIFSSNHMETINFACFMFDLVDMHDKVIVLTCDEVVTDHNYILAVGYALGKGKVIGSLNFPGLELPDWYKAGLKNTVSARSALLKLTLAS